MPYTPTSQTKITPYSVGNKVYGGGRPHPTIGPVDPLGYRERDLRTQARRNAILRRMRARQAGKFFSADSLRKV